MELIRNDFGSIWIFKIMTASWITYKQISIKHTYIPKSSRIFQFFLAAQSSRPSRRWGLLVPCCLCKLLLTSRVLKANHTEGALLPCGHIPVVTKNDSIQRVWLKRVVLVFCVCFSKFNYMQSSPKILPR